MTNPQSCEKPADGKVTEVPQEPPAAQEPRDNEGVKPIAGAPDYAKELGLD